MKDDILTAVKDDPIIAPLPSRLSFCLSPKQVQHVMEEIKDIENPEDNLTEQVTPTKLSVVKRSPTVAPSAARLTKNDEEVPGCSFPRKQFLRSSVSCDNYLSDAKSTFVQQLDELSEVDSQNSSAKGSPMRWAAKAEELAVGGAMTSSLISANFSPTKDPVMTGSYSHQSPLRTRACPRSCSANQLDVIVDILGVPSDLISQRDLNKRLFLLNGRKRMKKSCKLKLKPSPQKRNLQGCGKSKSCDVDDCSVEVVLRQRKTTKKFEVEAKRRSLYQKDCKGREAHKPCQECENVAEVVKDIELNAEIFHIPSPPVKRKVSIPSATPQPPTRAVEDMIQIEPISDDNVPTVYPSVPEQKKIDGSEPKRRFDAVKTLLEKARKKLFKLTDKSKPQSKTNNIEASHSSPCTPAEVRKNKSKPRHRSFSPIR